MAWGTNNPGGQPINTTRDYLEADVTFTGLPTNNSDFGRKGVAITVDGAVADQKVMEVFYQKDATNHVGGVATDPNWFYYWRQFIPLNRIATLNFSSPQGPNDAETDYVNRATTVYQSSSELGSADETGLHNFYQTIAHENEHIVLWEGWWGVGGLPNPALDTDSDTYPDSFESSPDGQAFYFAVGQNDNFTTPPGVPTSQPNAQWPSQSAGFNYEETQCANAEQQLIVTRYDEQDWSYDPSNTYQGKQH